MGNVKVALYTLGCKLNQAETESLAMQFSQAGFQLVPSSDIADIYIANTCTVTHVADRKSRHWLRLARRKNPHSLVIATGCYAQRAPEELTPIADLVVDNKKKKELPQIMGDLAERGFCLNGVEKFSPKLENLGGEKQYLNGRVRSMVKIQDGCHSSCAYCIVPQVRCYEYSLPAPQIIAEVRRKLSMGCKEVVLTGTKVGCYRDNGVNLNKLIELIVSETSIERLRLSSLQPQEIFAELLSLWQDERLCRHFHLALQSGSNTVLQRMNRRYLVDDYQQAINLIREAIAGVAITTDIIVGFPGESETEFEESYHFCQKADFANIHVFPFSSRPGTAAAEMPNQVSDRVKRERLQRMLELSQISRRKFAERLLGETMLVLWERETKLGSGIYSGLTDNYIRVFTHSQESLVNKISPVKLTGFCGQGIWGELVRREA